MSAQYTIIQQQQIMRSETVAKCLRLYKSCKRTFQSMPFQSMPFQSMPLDITCLDCCLYMYFDATSPDAHKYMCSLQGQHMYCEPVACGRSGMNTLVASVTLNYD